MPDSDDVTDVPAVFAHAGAATAAAGPAAGQDPGKDDNGRLD